MWPAGVVLFSVTIMWLFIVRADAGESPYI